MITTLIIFVVLFCLFATWCMIAMFGDDKFKFKVNVMSNLFLILSVLSLTVCILLVVEIFNNVIN